MKLKTAWLASKDSSLNLLATKRRMILKTTRTMDLRRVKHKAHKESIGRKKC